jgi:hypothetical protein
MQLRPYYWTHDGQIPNQLLCAARMSTEHAAFCGLLRPSTKRIGLYPTQSSVIAYADEVTLFLTSLSKIPKLRDILGCYEKASGAKINVQKSKAMAVCHGTHL